MLQSIGKSIKGLHCPIRVLENDVIRSRDREEPSLESKRDGAADSRKGGQGEDVALQHLLEFQ